MNKLTDAEIVTALECCSKKDCKQCPAFDEDIECGENIITLALDLIKHKDAEIERLTVENLKMVASIKRLKDEAIQTIREKCVEHQDFHKGDDGKFRAYISIEDLDNIISNL